MGQLSEAFMRGYEAQTRSEDVDALQQDREMRTQTLYEKMIQGQSKADPEDVWGAISTQDPEQRRQYLLNIAKKDFGTFFRTMSQVDAVSRQQKQTELLSDATSRGLTDFAEGKTPYPPTGISPSSFGNALIQREENARVKNKPGARQPIALNYDQIKALANSLGVPDFEPTVEGISPAEARQQILAFARLTSPPKEYTPRPDSAKNIHDQAYEMALREIDSHPDRPDPDNVKTAEAVAQATMQAVASKGYGRWDQTTFDETAARYYQRKLPEATGHNAESRLATIGRALGHLVHGGGSASPETPSTHPVAAAAYEKALETAKNPDGSVSWPRFKKAVQDAGLSDTAAARAWLEEKAKQ